MSKIKLLDCTLRDGGYINDWKFGEAPIKDMVKKLKETNVDILEIGFLKNEQYLNDRTVFNKVEQIDALIGQREQGMQYAAMIEVVNPIPVEQVAECSESEIDIIRVIVWKTRHDENGNVVNALHEGFEYCKKIVQKGYKLCVQPARVEQYSDEEFIYMCKLFSQIKPMAVYVVDSWGTQNVDDIMHYVKLADENLDHDIAIGYHGHNNMMQAYGNAIEFARFETDRELIVDASIYGIGRGAGNLNLELFAKYLNDNNCGQYNIVPMLEIYDLYLKEIYKEHVWGYSLPYYFGALYGCNPNYADYYDNELQLDVSVINEILQNLEGDDKVLFSYDKARRFLNKCQMENKKG